MSGVDVTVLITTFRRPMLLERCLAAAIDQDFFPYEILIVDDASNDSTLSMAYLYCERYPDLIRVITKPKNLGLANSRNVGVANAKGKYIAFLDDDDFWLAPDVLSKQYAKSLPGHIVCGSVRDSDGQILTEKLPKSWKSRLVYRNGFIHTSTVMISRNDILLVGGFDERMSRGVDSDLYRRMIFQNRVNILFIPDTLSHYELASSDRITTQKRSSWDKVAFLRETVYVLLKYRFLAINYPTKYLKRVLISLKQALK
jgi:glycosyltransferase involved in cell wall biosynthesis